MRRSEYPDGNSLGAGVRHNRLKVCEGPGRTPRTLAVVAIQAFGLARQLAAPISPSFAGHANRRVNPGQPATSSRDPVVRGLQMPCSERLAQSRGSAFQGCDQRRIRYARFRVGLGLITEHLGLHSKLEQRVSACRMSVANVTPKS